MQVESKKYDLHLNSNIEIHKSTVSELFITSFNPFKF